MTLVRSIAPVEVCRLNEESGGVILIDVSSESEFLIAHAAIAQNLPLKEISVERLKRENIERFDRIFVIGAESECITKACELLISLGFDHVYRVVGGTRAWARSGLITCTGPRSVS